MVISHQYMYIYKKKLSEEKNHESLKIFQYEKLIGFKRFTSRKVAKIKKKQ